MTRWDQQLYRPLMLCTILPTDSVSSQVHSVGSESESGGGLATSILDLLRTRGLVLHLAPSAHFLSKLAQVEEGTPAPWKSSHTKQAGPTSFQPHGPHHHWRRQSLQVTQTPSWWFRSDPAEVFFFKGLLSQPDLSHTTHSDTINCICFIHC